MTGHAAPAKPLQVATLPLSVSIGGAVAEVLFIGNAPGFVGLAQLNLRVPETIAGSGALALSATVGPPFSTSLQQGQLTIAIAP